MRSRHVLPGTGTSGRFTWSRNRSWSRNALPEPGPWVIKKMQILIWLLVVQVPNSPRGGSTGSCRRWQPSPKETGAPAWKAQERQFSSPFAEYFSPGSIFCIGLVLCSSSRRRRRPFDTKRRPFRPRRRLSKQMWRPSRQQRRLLVRKDAFSSMTAPFKTAPL